MHERNKNDLRLTCNPTPMKQEKHITLDSIYWIEMDLKCYEHYYFHPYYEKNYHEHPKQI